MGYELKKLLRDGVVFAVATAGYIVAKSFGADPEASVVALPEVPAEVAGILGAVGLFLYRAARARTSWMRKLDPPGGQQEEE
jgi:hypothetical protein